MGNNQTNKRRVDIETNHESIIIQDTEINAIMEGALFSNSLNEEATGVRS
jgi:hypothetical protein